MGFKEYEKNMSFLDMELSKTLGTSRTQRVLKEIHDHFRWKPLLGEEVPFYGMKEHASIDVESGLVMSTLLSNASEHDTNYFSYVVIKGIHTRKLPPKVYAERLSWACEPGVSAYQRYCGRDHAQG